MSFKIWPKEQDKFTEICINSSNLCILLYIQRRIQSKNMHKFSTIPFNGLKKQVLFWKYENVFLNAVQQFNELLFQLLHIVR